MAVDFRILREFGLVYVRVSGDVTIAEAKEAFRDHMCHPDCALGQKRFIDLSAMTSIESNPVGMMQFLAMMADHFVKPGVQTLMVYYAPTDATRSVAHTMTRSWDVSNFVVARVIDDEQEALQLLGLSAKSISHLLAQAA